MKKMSRNETIAIVVGILVVGSLIVVGIINALLRDSASQTQRAVIEKTMDKIEDTDGLIVDDIVVGVGEEATAGKVISVHYTGTLADGTKFDSSLDRGVPFQFILGVGQVIRGWDLGVVGMKVGGKRKLTIPSELGYGEQGIGPIPPNSTLIFEVELLDVASQ